MERFTFPMAVSGQTFAEDTSTLEFKGMASVFGTINRAFIPTRILKGAFVRTLREDGHRVKLLWQHETAWPIGLPTQLEEVNAGLEISGKVFGTTVGKDAQLLIREGVVDELSIGFDPVRWEMVQTESGELERHLFDLDLHEVSAVTLAANKDAKITDVFAWARGEHTPESLQRLNAALSGTDEATRQCGIDAVMETLCGAAEQFEGRELSRGNKRLITDAVTALNRLLTAAAKDTKDEDKNTDKPAAQPVDVAALMATLNTQATGLADQPVA